MPVKILALSGTTRVGSFNNRLVLIAEEGARRVGATVSHISLRDYPMPLYDGDLESEEGLPENAIKLKKIFAEHQGFLIAPAEYNASIPGVFKNAIDWLSRKDKTGATGDVFRGKYAALMCASPGSLGGIRSLNHIRPVLNTLGVTVLADQVAVKAAHEAFDETGRLYDPGLHQRVEALGSQLAGLLSKLATH